MVTTYCVLLMGRGPVRPLKGCGLTTRFNKNGVGFIKYVKA